MRQHIQSEIHMRNKPISRIEKKTDQGANWPNAIFVDQITDNPKPTTTQSRKKRCSRKIILFSPAPPGSKAAKRLWHRNELRQSGRLLRG